VIEVKYADNGKHDAACQKALDQIETMHYEAGLLADGIQYIVKYGMAFYKNNVW